eukprot:TRINITY_DN68763_c0_g1_i1.p1 TRINITY_DN68763_c0_g1~~TRINITY_DN68763_c0_g1_i1.p1  ORF type:complete len:197 (-),score=50.23 TRINITY_DN68763_c0_g1_i1:23-613(-)
MVGRKEKGRGRGKGSAGKRYNSQQVNSAELEKELEDLRKRVASAKDAEFSARVEEHKMRDELAAAEASRDVAKRRENSARDAAEDARRKAALRHGCIQDELSAMMSELTSCEMAAKEHARQEAAFKAELDALVLTQVESMELRDNLLTENAILEAECKERESRASLLEAQVKKLEEKNAKERGRVDLLKREVAARR